MEPLKSAGAQVFAISADPPAELAKLAQKLSLHYGLLSDPELQSKAVLGVATFHKHPQAAKYPKKAFLQPGVVIYRQDSSKAFSWVMKPSLWNLFGAARRMSPEEVTQTVRKL